VNAADWALYRDAGVSHLLSVSGLHVTMFAWLAGAAAGWAWRRSARLCLAVPAPRAAMWIGLVAAVLYALFSGWGVPAQRTVGLLAILALLRQAGARWPWPMSLCAAAAGVCAADPWALTQAGFWLSFCAVALLMAADHQAGPGWRGALRNAWRTQWLVTLGLAPLTLLLFQQLSIVGLLANAVAIPLVSYVITPLAMLGALCPPLWTLGAWCVALMNALLEALRVLPLAVWHLPWAPPWAQAAGMVGGVALAMPWPWRLKLGGLALCVPMFWPVIERPAPGHLELWLPDVGQGGAAVLRTHGHTMVFDAGPSWGPGSDAGQRVLLPLLRGLGERRLDLLMISHADQDHVGGAASLLAAMPVGRRLGAVPGGEGCRRGQRWTWDGVRFDVLWPLEPAAASERKRNGSSCVLRVEAAGRRVLLTGDIEAPQEARLLREADDRDGADARDALRASAPWQPDVIVTRLRGRGRAARGGAAVGLPEPLRPSEARRGGALRRRGGAGAQHRGLRGLALAQRSPHGAAGRLREDDPTSLLAALAAGQGRRPGPRCGRGRRAVAHSLKRHGSTLPPVAGLVQSAGPVQALTHDAANGARGGSHANAVRLEGRRAARSGLRAAGVADAGDGRVLGEPRGAGPGQGRGPGHQLAAEHAHAGRHRRVDEPDATGRAADAGRGRSQDDR